MIGAIIGGAVALCVLTCLILYGATREDDLEEDVAAMRRDAEWREIDPGERHAYRRWCAGAGRDPLAEDSWRTWEGVKREIMGEGKKVDMAVEIIKAVDKVLIGVCAIVLAFCVCCLDSEPIPGWLFPAMMMSVIGIFIGVVLLNMWAD